MPPLILEGHTLGEKHKHFNRIVQNAVDNNKIELTEITIKDTDIENLIKIDVASKSKNVQYIIEVLKGNDMLYISRAIKKSTRLITEQEYMHIINPEYLHEELFPYMLTKAVNKLLLNIRLHLKDEERIKLFYFYIKHNGNNDDANKWLFNCNIHFVESIIQKEEHIPLHVYRRLCKRSITFLKYYGKVREYCPMQKVLFLLKSHTKEFLDVLDMYAKDYNMLPKLNQKYTEIVMRYYPNRIIDNFEKYVDSVNLSVMAKYLKKEKIEEFLFKYMKAIKTRGYFRDYNILKPFISNMCKEDKFEFVKKLYVNKDQTAIVAKTNEGDECATVTIPICDVNSYRWYEYADFDVAFLEIKKLLLVECSTIERCAMLSVLIGCSRKHSQNINVLLQYYYDNHKNELFKFKIQFVNNVIARLSTHEFDSTNWNILNLLFHNLEVYTESHYELQSCLNSIVLYNVIHDEIVPDIVQRKLKFNTLKKIQCKLSDEQRTKVFTYLLSFISTKIKNKTIENKSDLEDAISLIVKALQLLNDWNKCLSNCGFLVSKIKELVRIQKENSWQVDFSSIYNVNKSYRRYMFEQSIRLCPGEDVCLNALKHDPDLITRHSDVADMLRVDDAVSMPRLLAKLRIYWPHSLAQEWSNSYMKQIDTNIGHRAAIEGLMLLLSQNHLKEFAEKHIPKNFKINWNKLDPVQFSLQKNIARYLHKARPLINLDLVLLYAKGDYLQYALPSLCAISHNISKKQSVNYVTKLVNSPASLQKHGLRLAFTKLKCDEVIPIFFNTWQSSPNTTIRTHIFTHTYNLMCKEKNSSLAVKLWNLLEEFIETSAKVENKVFNKLGNPKNVPTCVQGQFYMKSYQYLTSLPPAVNCKGYINKLLTSAPNVMDLLEENFVADKLLSPIKEIISSPKAEYLDIMSSFVLFGQTEEEQCKRFRRVLVPALEHIFTLWNTINDKKQYVYKEKVDALLQTLFCCFTKLLYFRKIVVPVKLFTDINIFIEQNVPVAENYLRHTNWTLTCEYVKLVGDHKYMFDDVKRDRINFGNWLPLKAELIWETVHVKISPLMGSVIVKLLKEDTNKYFASICWLFSAALQTFFSNLLFASPLITMETLKYMLVNENFIPSYIMVCNLLPTYGIDEDIRLREEILAILSAHPSLEVQMHYHDALDILQGNSSLIYI